VVVKLNSLKNSKGSRDHSGVECFRVVAILMVISVHLHSFELFPDSSSKCLHLLINQGSRWVIPFFTIIAGYFWGKKVRINNQISQVSMSYGLRLFKIWVFWCLIYLIIPDDIDALRNFGFSAFIKVPFWRLLVLLKNPQTLLFVGSSYHLWFFIALLWAMAVTTMVLKFGEEKWLLWIGCALYSFGLIAGSWSNSPIGITIPFHTKHGPFFSTIFFIIGWYLSSDRYIFSRKIILILILGGLGVHILEIYLLWGQFEVSPTSHAYLLGTLPFGTGIAILALSKPNLGKNTIIPRLGKYVIGVYAVHYIFVDLFSHVQNRFDSHVVEFILPVAVFLISLLTVLTLQKNWLLKRFVS
jgi:surface polysaccharide O-acyltransferase-like enzyme